jgi:hypothetical protein
MACERLVAVSYPVDDEFALINAEVLDRDAALAFLPRLGGAQRGEAVTGVVNREDYA